MKNNRKRKKKKSNTKVFKLEPVFPCRYSRKGVEAVEAFDAVVVSSGHHWKKRFPAFPGMDVFKGRQMHSHSYKDFTGFENLKVVVVGVGNSGI